MTRNVFQDTFLGSAALSKFLVQRLDEYRQFYDEVGLGKAKP